MVKSTDQTERAGVYAVGRIFTDLGWSFREQPTSDFGIDAQAEKLNDDGLGGGRLIGLQIKSGPSYFKKRGDDYVYYGDERHRTYWTNHSLPVFIIIHDPESGLTLWQKVEEHLITEGANGRWSIAIPASQTLDAANETYIVKGIASDLSSLLRHRLTLDLPVIQQFSEHEVSYLYVEDWVNKTLNFRSTRVVFGEDPDGPVDVVLDTWLPAHTITRFMAFHFPWLDWRIHEYQGDEFGAGEVACWVIETELGEIGKAALTLERFYTSKLIADEPGEAETSFWNKKFDGDDRDEY